MNAPVTKPEIMEAAEYVADELLTWEPDQIRKYNAFGLTVYAHCKSVSTNADGFYAELCVAAYGDEITDEVFDSRNVEQYAYVMAGTLVLRAIASGKARVVEVEQ